MEKEDYMKLSESWDNSCSKSKNYITKPSVLYARNDNDDIYYVGKDFSTIVHLTYYVNKKNYTYSVPKKYLEAKLDKFTKFPYYSIKDPRKLELVSCPKNEGSDFIKVISKILKK
jgi:hypothetical protein